MSEDFIIKSYLTKLDFLGILVIISICKFYKSIEQIYITGRLSCLIKGISSSGSMCPLIAGYPLIYFSE